MQDSWLRSIHFRWVHSPQSQEVHDMVVSDFMAQQERKWDVNKIENLFSSFVSQAILLIPLYMEQQDDVSIFFNTLVPKKLMKLPQLDYFFLSKCHSFRSNSSLSVTRVIIFILFQIANDNGELFFFYNYDFFKLKKNMKLIKFHF